MRHKKRGKKLGRESAPRKALLRSLATSFLIYEQIKTTKAKAQAVRPIVEKIITLGKVDTLHHRRQAMKVLYLPSAVKKLFEVLGPRFKERQGGYTRIVKLSRRQSDAAEMAILELVEKMTADQKASAHKEEMKENKRMAKKEKKPKAEKAPKPQEAVKK